MKDCCSTKVLLQDVPQDMLRVSFAITELRITQIDKWVDKLKSHPSLAIISGFLPEDTPGVGTFYDF